MKIGIIITLCIIVAGILFELGGATQLWLDSQKSESFSMSIPTSPPGANAKWGYAEDTAYRMLTLLEFRGEPLAIIETPLGNLFLSTNWPEIRALKPGTFFKVTDEGIVTLKKEEATLMRIPKDHFDEGCPLTDDEIRKVIEYWDRQKLKKAENSSSA